MNKIYATLTFILISSSVQALPLPVQTIKAYNCDRCVDLSHELLQDKWSIANKPLNFIVSNKQKSYGYRQEITGQQLQTGIPLSFLAAGAVIRVSPINTSFSPALSLQTPNNKTMSLKEASSLYSEDEPLERNFSKESETIAQIKPELGKGRFILKSLTKEQNNSTYMINVLDKFSITHLDVETSSLYYHYGDTLKVKITLNDDDHDYDADDIEALLVDPAGKMTPMDLKELKANQFEATYVLNSELSDNGEHWYVKVNVETEGNEGTIKRNGQTTFSYSIPSASLVQIKKTSSKPLTFSATVEVATASRYSLQAILFKKNNDVFNALETAQTGTWLEPGIHSVEFTFDNSQQLADDSLYLGYLRLVDYGQLKMIYHYDKPIKLSQLME